MGVSLTLKKNIEKDLKFEREENDGFKDENVIVLSLLLVKKFILDFLEVKKQ